MFITKYDFPTSMVNCVPGTFMYLNKEVLEDENGKEHIVTSSYDVLCHIKRKNFEGSSCSVWSSHLFDNRHNELSLHQVVPSREVCPINVQKCLVMLLDILTFYCLQTNKKDTKYRQMKWWRFPAWR